MEKTGSYQSKIPREGASISYSAEENAVWRDLCARQEGLLPGRACEVYLKGLAALDLPRRRIPQLAEINDRLARASDFGVQPVPALISPQRFFGLLARRKFPVATFIRRRSDFDYLEEPDIFHEVFGHCPMLADPTFADLLEDFGRAAATLGEAYHWSLQRLFWFTVEFGLIAEPQGTRPRGTRIFGAGILSSPGETCYAIDSRRPERRPLDFVTLLRTPYRIDIFQTVYYVIQDFAQLRRLLNQDLRPAMTEAKAKGLLPPTFPPKAAA